MRWTEEQLAKYQQRGSEPPRLSRSSDCLPVALEHQEQVAFVQWLRLQGIRHNATPNGGHRASKTAKVLKAEGVASGFPDITVWPEIGSGLPILYVEMKRTAGGRVTSEQQEWIDYLNGLGFPVVAKACRGCSEAIHFVRESWGGHSSQYVRPFAAWARECSPLT